MSSSHQAATSPVAVEPKSDGDHVVVSYTDEFSVWPRLAEEFKRRLPLRQLQWRNNVAASGATAVTQFNTTNNATPSGTQTPGTPAGSTTPTAGAVLNLPQSPNANQTLAPNNNTTTSILTTAGSLSTSNQQLVSRGMRVIDSLHVDFIPLSPSDQARTVTSVGLLNAHRQPLVHLYFVYCDESEVYKSQVRKQVRDWHAWITSTNNSTTLGATATASSNARKQPSGSTEYLIVHVIEQEAPRNNLINLRSSVLDKLRSDFGRDRVVQIRLHDILDYEMWHDVMSHLGDVLLTSFATFLLQLEEECRRLDAQRLLPGWNICTFFATKEAIAMAFEQMCLYEEALVCYDELEAAFASAVIAESRQKGCFLFMDRFGGTDPDDATAPILETTRKPYREWILESKISVFDFYVYLLARQIHLLLRQGRVTEVLERALVSIAQISLKLDEQRDLLGIKFKPTWIYATAMHLMQTCDASVRKSPLKSPILEKFLSIRAKMMYYARRQLDRLGSMHGYLKMLQHSEQSPAMVPWTDLVKSAGPSTPTMVRDSPNVSPERGIPQRSLSLREVTGNDLTVALSSVGQFDKLYLTLTEKTIQSMHQAHRERSMWQLMDDWASLLLYRKHFDRSLIVFDKLHQAQKLSHWQHIDGHLLVKLLQCYKELKRWNKVVETCCDVLSASKTILTKEKELLWIQEWMQYVTYLEEDLILNTAGSFLSVSILTQNRPMEPNADRLDIELIVNHSLRNSVAFSGVKLTLISNKTSSADVLFTCGEVSLVPGANKIIVSCSEPNIVGSFVAESCQLRWGHLVLASSFLGSKKTMFTLNRHSTVLAIRSYPPPKYWVAGKAAVEWQILCLRSVTLQQLQIHLQSDQISWQDEKIDIYVNVKDQEKKKISVDFAAGRLVIPELEADCTASFVTPLQSNETLTKVVAHCEFILLPEQRSATFERSVTVQLAQPLQVSHKFHFYEQCALVQLQVSHQLKNEPLILFGVETELRDSESALALIETPHPWQKSILLPNVPVSALFKLTSNENAATSTHWLPCPLRAIISYGFVRDELRRYTFHALDDFLLKREMLSRRVMLHDALSSIIDQIDLCSYISTGQFPSDISCALPDWYSDEEHRSEDAALIQDFFVSVGGKKRAEFVTKIEIRQVLQTLTVPACKTLLNVDLVLEEPEKELVVGHMVQCRLSCHQTTATIHGNQDASTSERTNSFVFEVEANMQQWLLAGRQRQHFDLSSSNKKNFTLGLIPLKTGLLSLPRVEVQCLTDATCQTVCVTNGAQVLVHQPLRQSQTHFIGQEFTSRPTSGLTVPPPSVQPSRHSLTSAT